MESLLVEEELLSRQTGITTQKRYNFLSNRWIALNVLHEFQEACFLVLPIESLLVEEEVLVLQTVATAKRATSFDPTAGSRSKFYSSFRISYPCSTSRIPTHRRGCLVAPERNNS